MQKYLDSSRAFLEASAMESLRTNGHKVKLGEIKTFTEFIDDKLFLFP